MELLGEALRKARTRRGLTLRAVASAADVSPSLLSQVETGKTQPSVGTLYAVVAVLQVSLDELLGLRRDGGAKTDARPIAASAFSVQRPQGNPTIVMETGVRWERLAVNGPGTADALITTYPPGSSSSGDGKPMRHSGIEYGYILDGELTLTLDAETYVLRRGDSVCFESMRPHQYQNRTDSIARGLWHVVGRAPQDDGVADGSPPSTAGDALDALGRLS